MAKIVIHTTQFPPLHWVAYHDGDEERPWLHGLGKTSGEALADLARIEEEELEHAAQEDDDYALDCEYQQRVRDMREGFDND